MAKILHSTPIDTINELFSDAKQREVMHLINYASEWHGNSFLLEGGREVINFGTCGYLGLETDDRLKKRSAEYALSQGTQFSISRAYMLSNDNKLLEDKLSEMFDGCPVLLLSSVTLAHQSIIPILIGVKDVIVMDQQVHASVQKACHLAGFKNVQLEMIRHSNLEMLERKILELRTKYDKIWYMIDGVYSMYGDVAPYEGIKTLMDKYPELHVYVDDAHGVGWTGSKGTGTAFDAFHKNDRVMLVTALSKGFGAIGGMAVFSNQSWYDKIHLFGGSLSHSHPLPPPIIGAAMASVEIHLSPEIEVMQKELADLIQHCNHCLAMTDLPVMSNPKTPIFFIATGQPKVGFNFNKRVLDEGFYTSIGIFPAVPLKNTGMRFTITRHVTKNQIEDFIDACHYHYHKALEEENVDLNKIRRAFKLPPTELKSSTGGLIDNNLKLEVFNSIDEIDEHEWNSYFTDASWNWDYVKLVENAFKDNELKEENWDFYYFKVLDENGKTVLFTFFTSGIFKDDVFAPTPISDKLELKRKKNPYFLTSLTIAQGSYFTEGNHLYVDKKSDWKAAFILVMDKVGLIQDEIGANSVFLRDYEEDDAEFKKLLFELGFARVKMPNSNLVNDLGWNSEDEFLQRLSKKNRKNVRQEVLRYKDNFEITYHDQVSTEELEVFFNLYLNVHHRNRSINMFFYPKKVFTLINEDPAWEMVVLNIVKDLEGNPINETVGVVFCYKGKEHYTPLIAGINYDFNEDYKVYKQLVYQVVERGNIRKNKVVFLGLSADVEKKKVGAKQIPKVAYFQSKDNFNMTLLENITSSD